MFAIQFDLLLLMFGVDVGPLFGFVLIGVTYFIMTIIPSFWLGQLGIREAVSLFVIGAFSNNDAGILSASLALWIINLVIPALIGGVLLFTSAPKD